MSPHPALWLAAAAGAVALGRLAGPPPCSAPEMHANSVRVFAQAAATDSASAAERSIAGARTGLCHPRDLAVDARGRLYVLDRRVITVYDSGSTGDVAPVRSIVLTDRDFEGLSLGLDRKGNLYVGTDEPAPTDSGSITVYPRGAAGDRPPLRSLRGPRTGLRGPLAVAVDAEGRIYATTASDTVRIFARGASGDAAPKALLAGPATGLARPYGIAVDSRGRLYVANGSGNSITVYAPGATGNATPARRITTPSGLGPGGLNNPTWLALGPGDTVFVMTARGVFVYGPDASGEVTPLRVIRTALGMGLAVGRDGSVFIPRVMSRIAVFAPGAADSAEAIRVFESSTAWRAPTGMAVGPTGDTLYIARAKGSAVSLYASGAEGIANPVRMLEGPVTQISDPQGVAVDRHGTLYVANGPQPILQGAVRVYGPDADGLAEPDRILSGFATRLSHPSHIAFDSRGRMYVANTDGYVTIYRGDAAGNTAPIRTIAGPNTLLRRPAKLAIGPGDTLLVLNTFDFSRWPFGSGYVTVTVFAPHVTGDIEPVRSIVVNGGFRTSGSKLQLMSPTGIAVDRRGSVYVANLVPGKVVAYEPGATGDVMPQRALSWPGSVFGSGTYPVAVAVSPFGALYVASWAEPFWDRWWWRNREWAKGPNSQ